MSATTRRKVWIDTDAGVDDAQAILMTLAYSDDIDVIGISTVCGNASSHQVALNVLRLLKVAERLDVPIYKGCTTSLLGTKADSSFYHGQDGFGDVPDIDPADPDLIQSERATDALIRAAQQYKGEVTLMCLGPLTNIALAVRLDPEFGKNLSASYIMGGCYEGKGNATMCAEFNFHADPEAALIVLENLRAPITMACWELCLNHSLSWKWYRDVLSTTPTKKGQLIKAIETKAMSSYYNQNNNDGPELEYETADQFISAFIVNPKVIRKSLDVYGTVELNGGETRGQLVCDWRGLKKRKPNLTIVTEVDKDLYMELLHKALQ